MTFLSRADVSPPSIYRPTNHVAFLLRMVSLTFVIFFFFFLSHFISLYFYIKHRCTEHCSAKLWSALKTNDDLEIKKKCKNERGRLIVHRRALSIRRSLYFRINRSFVLCIYYQNVLLNITLFDSQHCESLFRLDPKKKKKRKSRIISKN